MNTDYSASRRLMLRRASGLSLLAATGLMTSGCATRSLWQPPNGETENVSSVWISADNKALVFVGDTYHYIFDAPTPIAWALRTPHQRWVKASLDAFKADRNGVMTGNYRLFLDTQAGEDSRRDALAAGFERRDNSVLAEGALKGRRYLAGDIKLPHTQRALNQTYRVHIDVEPSLADQARKVALTPLTVLVDGTVVLATIPLNIATGGLVWAYFYNVHR